MTPKASVVVRSIQTKRLDRSAHSSVLTPVATKIRTPPIVGVPDFWRCDCGPSVRTRWPIW